MLNSFEQRAGMDPSGPECPCCGSGSASVFYILQGVPTNSVLLLPTREQALNYATGDIALALCGACGFIFNASFEPSLLTYSSNYEATQSFSARFNTFHRRLAEHLIQRYDLYGKDVIEIGCGQGEFLTLLCDLGGNRGVGFDPACASGRDRRSPNDRTTFVRDFYSEDYADYQADFICCKMTLEHIQRPAKLVRAIRHAIGERAETIVFFQVPDVSRILRELAFWDIYYEHCSYFSSGSLVGLFERCGFDVIDCWKAYDGQYLMMEARPRDETEGGTFEQQGWRDGLTAQATRFANECPRKVWAWCQRLAEYGRRGERVVVWGGGSKAVAFLTTLQVWHEIEYVVDINPRRQETYVAGTGQKIVGPAFLREYLPDRVIILNPVYRDEIERELDRLDVSAELIAV